MKYFIPSIVIISCALFNIFAFAFTGKSINAWAAVFILALLIPTLRMNRSTKNMEARRKKIERSFRNPS